MIDRSVINPVLANEPILAGRVTEKGAGVGLAPLIPEGERAVAVPISQVTGVSGFINPGSEVDILLTGSPGEGGERVTTTILENVVVLTTGHRLEVNAKGQPGKRTRGEFAVDAGSQRVDHVGNERRAAAIHSSQSDG